MKHVLIQVADPDVLRAVQSVLHSRNDLQVMEADPDAASLVNHPTVVLSDLLQGDQSSGGFDSNDTAPVIVITTPANEQLAVQALREGAASYVPGRLVATELNHTLDSVGNTIE